MSCARALPRGRRLLVARWVLVALASTLPIGHTGAEPIRVSAIPVTLNPADPEQTHIGALVYRGGLELRSSDERFGGLSGLLISPDGTQLTAVTDQGHWLVVGLTYDGSGQLTGVHGAEMRPLCGARL